MEVSNDGNAPRLIDSIVLEGKGKADWVSFSLDEKGNKVSLSNDRKMLMLKSGDFRVYRLYENDIKSALAELPSKGNSISNMYLKNSFRGGCIEIKNSKEVLKKFFDSNSDFYPKISGNKKWR